MLQQRYFFYIVFVNMLANVIALVPQILLKYRFEGSVMAIGLATPIGMLLMYVFLKSLSVFPGKGFPEILALVVPKWCVRLILVYFVIIWFCGGAFSLVSMAEVSIRYINPENSLLFGITMFLAAACMISRYKSNKIVYLIEIILILDTPLILLITLKAFFSQAFNWNAIMIVGRNFSPLPNWVELSAATYIFSGYANLAIFNRMFQKPVSAKWAWWMGGLGFGILLTSFFIPIAFQGADGVGHYVYPWVTTADSMLIELGFVERVLYVFLLLYAGISVGSIITHWHVALEMIKDILPTAFSGGKLKSWSPWLVMVVFSIFTFVAGFFFNEGRFYVFGAWWLRIRFLSECLLVAMVFYAARRSRKP